MSKCRFHEILQENERGVCFHHRRSIVQLHLYLFSHVVQQSLREFCCVHRFDDPQQSWRRVLGLRQHPLHFALPCFIGEQHMHAHLLWTIYNRYVEIFSTPSSWFTNAGLFLCQHSPFHLLSSCHDSHALLSAMRVLCFFHEPSSLFQRTHCQVHRCNRNLKVGCVNHRSHGFLSWRKSTKKPWWILDFLVGIFLLVVWKFVFVSLWISKEGQVKICFFMESFPAGDVQSLFKQIKFIQKKMHAFMRTHKRTSMSRYFD